MNFRCSQVQRLEENPNLTIGDVTSVNITQLKGGLQRNVVPAHLNIMTDFRLAVDVDPVKFEATIKDWCEDAGGDIDVIFHHKGPYAPPTKIDDSNIFWGALTKAFDDL